MAWSEGAVVVWRSVGGGGVVRGAGMVCGHLSGSEVAQVAITVKSLIEWKGTLCGIQMQKKRLTFFPFHLLMKSNHKRGVQNKNILYLTNILLLILHMRHD